MSSSNRTLFSPSLCFTLFLFLNIFAFYDMSFINSLRIYFHLYPNLSLYNVNDVRVDSPFFFLYLLQLDFFHSCFCAVYMVISIYFIYYFISIISSLNILFSLVNSFIWFRYSLLFSIIHFILPIVSPFQLFRPFPPSF